MRKRNILIFILLFASIISSYGQNEMVILNSGTPGFTPILNKYSGTVIDAKTKAPLVGAFVTIITTIGSFHMSTDEEGKFNYSLFNIDGKDIKIEVAHLGYKIFEKYYYTGLPNVDAGKIKMVIDKQKLDEVIVKSRRILFKNVGDTTIFFPANTFVREDATILDALSKIPGVKATETSVEVFGRVVEKTYVNGRAIFGEDDPMAALNNLDAKLVSRVLAYDEYDENSQLKSGKHGRKRKVLNLITFDFFDKSLNLNSTAGIGMDLDKNMDNKYTPRYLAGIGGGIYNEGSQLTAEITSSNSLGVQNGQQKVKASIVGNGDSKNHSANIKYNKTLRKDWKLAASYVYSHRNSKNRNIRHDEYFDTSSGDLDRFYTDTSSNHLGQNYHNAGLKFTKSGAKHRANIGGDFSYTKKNSNNISTNKITEKDLIFSQTSVRTDNKNHSYNANIYGDNNIKFNNNHGISLSYGVKYGNLQENGSHREDSLDRVNNKYISNTGINKNIASKASVAYNYNSDKAGAISLGYNISYINDNHNTQALDINTGKIDSTLTREMTTNNLNHNIFLNYTYSYKHWRFSPKIVVQKKVLNRIDAFPEAIGWDKSYHALLPSVNISYSNGEKGHLQLNYNTRTGSISQQMVSNKLTYTNPLFLFTGNEDLKQEYNHSVHLTYSLPRSKTGSFYNFSFTSNITNNKIDTKRIFYNDSQYLPEYNYTTSPGAILTTYENIGRAESYTLRTSALFSSNIINPEFSINYNYSKNPMYVGDKATNVVQHKPTVSIGLSTNTFKAPINLKFSIESSYLDSKSPIGISDNTITGNVNLNLEVDFLKRMFADIHGNYYIEHSFTQGENRVNDLILNATLGCRLFKNRRGKISITCNDILNSPNSFTSSITAEQISKTWRARNSRFLILTFAYKFSKQK